MSQHHPLIAIRTAIGMGVFDAFAAAGGAELTVDQLNEKTKGDRDLLGKRLFSLGPPPLPLY